MGDLDMSRRGGMSAMDGITEEDEEAEEDDSSSDDYGDEDNINDAADAMADNYAALLYNAEKSNE